MTFTRLDVVGNCDDGRLVVRRFGYPVFEKALASFLPPFDRFGRTDDGRADALAR